MERTFLKRETFKGHSGQMLDFKIECDALSEDDWDCLAWIIRKRLMADKVAYNRAIGIPRGGIPFARALNRYANPKANVVLLADDVWTTGGSMRKAHQDLNLQYENPEEDFANSCLPGEVLAPGEEIRGVVAFARAKIDPWVMAAFVLGEVSPA
jgi:hypoxanthine phosphoribosyltransferase